MKTIPLLDAAEPRFGDDLLDACERVGFVAVTGHGIEPSRFGAMRSLLIRLFDVDDAVKLAGAVSVDNYRGFIPLSFFTPNRPEASGELADRYEGYKLHWECPPGHRARAECPLYGANRWAEHVPDMAATVLGYWEACDRFARRLLDVFADALSIDHSTMRSWHEEPLTNMTLLHYPPATSTRPEAGIHPHKDTNVVTLLNPDPIGGLEVRTPDGDWAEATCPTDGLLVDIGEMLELWSGGRFVATPHRVVNVAEQDRYAFPYFVVPNHDLVVEPLVPCRPGFSAAPMPVGELSAEVWRTNWPEETPSADGYDLGSLDR